MRQISGGESSIPKKRRRTQQRRSSIKKLAESPPTEIFLGAHPSEAFITKHVIPIKEGTKEAYQIWDDLLMSGGNGVKTWKEWDAKVEKAGRETRTVLRRMRSSLFDWAGTGDDEIPNKDTELWKLYEDAWKRGYESTGVKAPGVKLDKPDVKWLNDKLVKVRGSIGHYARTSDQSSNNFERYATSSGGHITQGLFKEERKFADFQKEWKSREVFERRRNTVRAMKSGKFAQTTTSGEFLEYVYGHRQLYGGEYHGKYLPPMADILEYFELEHPSELRTIDQEELKEFLESSQVPYTRKVALDEYPEMFLKQSATEAWNRAFIRGLEASDKATGKQTMVKVFDGPECGWNSHEDPKKANGLLVSLREAQLRPLGHPNCIRRFYNPDKPPKGGKKTQEQAQGVIRSQGNQFKRTSMIVGGVSAFSYLITAAARAGNANLPILLGAIKNDLATVIPRWREFEIRLVAARTILGDQLATNNLEAVGLWRQVWPNETPPKSSAYISPDRMRQIIQKNLDNHFENDQPLTAWTINALGLDNPQLTRDAWKDIIYDWADYAEYSEHRMKMSFVELLERHRMVEDALGDYHAWDDVAAFRFHMSAPRGVNIGGLSAAGWDAALQYLKTGNWDLMSEDIVRQVATAINPFPVVRADFGKYVKFTMRVSVEGRREIATKMWARHQAHVLERRLKNIVDAEQEGKVIMLDLERIKKQYGGELPLVTKKDIVDALLPRITLFGGKMFSTTLFRENGEVQWAGRFLGKGWMSWLRTETIFRRSTLDRVIRGMREGKLTSRQAMDILKEEAIHDVEAFRNSPIAANLKFYGQGLQSIGMKLKPSERLGTLKTRYNFFGWRGLYDWDSLTPEEKLAGIKPIKRKEIKILRGKPDFKGTGEGKIYPGAQTNIVIFPGKPVHMTTERSQAKFKRRRDPITQEYTEEIIEPSWLTLARFRLWRGSIVQMARDFRLDIDELTQEWRAIQSRYSNVIENINPKQIKQLRTWDEVRRYVANIHEPDPMAHFQRFGSGRADVEVFWSAFPSQGLPEDSFGGFVADADRVQAYLDKMFPGMEKPKFYITDAIAGEIQYDEDLKAILIHPSMAGDWDGSHAEMRKKAVRLGWIPQNTDLPIGTLFHEVSHHITANMSDREYRNLWRAVFQTDPRNPKLIRNFEEPGWDLLDAAYLKDTVYNTGDEVPSKTRVRNSIARWMGVERDKEGNWRHRVHPSAGHRNWTDVKTGLGRTRSWKKGDPLTHTNRHRIETGVSGYASMSPDELLAEAFTEYMVAMHPRSVARGVGEYYENLGYKKPLFAMQQAERNAAMSAARSGEWGLDNDLITNWIKTHEQFGDGVDVGYITIDGTAEKIRIDTVSKIDGVDVVAIRTDDNRNFTFARVESGKLGVSAVNVSDLTTEDTRLLAQNMNTIISAAKREFPFVEEIGLKVRISETTMARPWGGTWDPQTGLLELDYIYLLNGDAPSHAELMRYAKILGEGIKPKFAWAAGNVEHLFLHEMTHAKHTLSLQILTGLSRDRQELYFNEMLKTFARNNVAFRNRDIVTDDDIAGALGQEMANIMNSSDEKASSIAVSVLTEIGRYRGEGRRLDEALINKAMVDLYELGVIDTPIISKTGIFKMADAVQMIDDGKASHIFYLEMYMPIDAVHSSRLSGSIYGSSNVFELVSESVVGARGGHKAAENLGATVNGLFDQVILEGHAGGREMKGVMAAHMGSLTLKPGDRNFEDIVRRTYPKLFMRVNEYESFLNDRLYRQYDGFHDMIREFNDELIDGSMRLGGWNNYNVLDFTPDNGGRFTVSLAWNADDEQSISMLWEQGRSVGIGSHLEMEQVYNAAKHWKITEAEDLEEFIGSPDLGQTILRLGETVERVMKTVTESMPPNLKELGDVFRVEFLLMPDNADQTVPVAAWASENAWFKVNLRVIEDENLAAVEAMKDPTYKPMRQASWRNFIARLEAGGVDLETYPFKSSTGDGLPAGVESMKNTVVHEFGHAQETMFWHSLGLLDRERSKRLIEKFMRHLADHNIVMIEQDFSMSRKEVYFRHKGQFIDAIRKTEGFDQDEVGKELVDRLRSIPDTFDGFEDMQTVWSDVVIHFYKKGVLPSTMIDKGWVVDADYVAQTVDTNPLYGYRELFANIMDEVQTYKAAGSKYGTTNVHELIAESLAYTARTDVPVPPTVEAFAAGLKEIYAETEKEFIDQHGQAVYIWFLRKLGRMGA